MSQVTAVAVSANNLQTLLSNHSLAYSSALARYSMGFSQCKSNRATTKAAGTRGPALSGTVKDQESVY